MFATAHLCVCVCVEFCAHLDLHLFLVEITLCNDEKLG